MINSRIRGMVRAIVVAALLVGACGSDDEGSAAALATESPEVTEPLASPTTGAPAEVPVFTAQDAIDVVEAIGLAYNTYDTDLFLSVAAEDFLFVDERGTADRSTQASYFPALREGRHRGARIGEFVVLSEEPFVVAEDVVITATFYPPEGRVGTSTYTLVVEDGQLKVREHRWTGDLL